MQRRRNSKEKKSLRFSLKVAVAVGVVLVAQAAVIAASLASHITLERCKKLSLPILEIDTLAGRKIKSRENYVPARFALDEGNVSGSCNIRGRGNTSWNYAKKPYLLKLDEAQELLGLPRAQKWVLLANQTDRSSLRNWFALYLNEHVFANAADGFSGWSPKARFITLFLNGKYQGLYLLSEKIERNPARLHLGETDFLLCADRHSKKSADFRITTAGNVQLDIEEDVCPPERYEQIRAVVQHFEDVLYAGEDFFSLIDTESFVNWYLVNEFAKNRDADFLASCWIVYNGTTGKLHMGPVWDFDIGFGNSPYDNNFSPEGFWVNRRFWFEKLTANAEFMALVRNAWAMHAAELEQSFDVLAARAEAMTESAELNDVLWRTIGSLQWPRIPGCTTRKTYRAETDYLYTWCKERFAWMNETLTQQEAASYAL